MRTTLAWIALAAVAFGQTPPDSIDATIDSLAIDAVEIDSLAIDAADLFDADLADTTLPSLEDPDDSDTTDDDGLDTIVYAKAVDSLVFRVRDKKMHLYNGGELKHKETHLSAGKIDVDFERSEVEAYMLPEQKGDTSVPKPSLEDKGQIYFGDRMRYNFRTERGYMTYALTDQEQGAYSGARIRMMDRLTYFVQNGFYTTCDAESPHYGFFVREMKVVPKEQVVGRWIFLTIGGVPLPIPLPFAVFPIEKGRRSGIIAPVYGYSGDYGYYLKRGGYFWAINDYTDLRVLGDYYFKGGWGTRSRFRYKMRYNFDGALFGGYTSLAKGEPDDADYAPSEEWFLRWNHHHDISPTSRFDANLEFMSSNYFQRTTTNFEDLLTQDVVSNATYSTSFENVGVSLTANYSRRQNLSTGDVDERLPSVSVSKSQFYPFRGKNVVGDQSWYDLIGLSYSGQLLNDRKIRDKELEQRYGYRHSITPSASPKFSFFTVSPSFRFEEKYYFQQTRQYLETYYAPSDGGYVAVDSLRREGVDEFGIVRTFSAGLGARTKLYGMFPVRAIGIEAFRHTIEPNVSYSYRPDFSDPIWGYYDEYETSDGETVRYDKFQNGVFGGAPRGEQQNINFSVGNVVEMKTIADPSDTSAEAEKFRLLNANVGSSYNFAADSLHFSTMNASFRTEIRNWISVQGGARYSFYDVDSAGREYQRYYWENGGFPLRYTGFNVSVSTTLSGDKFASEEEKTESDEEEDLSPEEELYIAGADYNYDGVYDRRDPDFTTPWSLSLHFRYSENQPNPWTSNVSASVNGNFDISITRKWKFTLSGGYDLRREEFTTPRVTVSRDLHCWLMSFNWTPVGTYTGYQFELRVKADHLRDLKVEKSDQFYRNRY
jgi:lipopolysaccharide assembly outer membrane protein LptD (OstA)